MDKIKLAPFKCPACGSSERIALDFEAVDRRYVLGADPENGSPTLDDNEYDTICKGGPQEFWCLACDHSWPFAEGMKYDRANADGVEIVETPLEPPGEGRNVVVGNDEGDRMTLCKPCALADGYDPDVWMYSTNAPCWLCERDTQEDLHTPR